jgi:hypothetical protein
MNERNQSNSSITHLINPGREIEHDLELGPDERHGALPPPARAHEKRKKMKSALPPEKDPAFLANKIESLRPTR